MAPNVTTNTTQPKVWINGQYLPAAKGTDGKWYVEIDGKRIEVDPNDLFGMNSDITEHPQYLVDYYSELLAKNEEKKDYLKAAGEAIKSQIEGVKTQYYAILNSFGVKSYSEITDAGKKADAKEFYTNLSGLRSDKISNSNQYLTACRTSFDYALEKGEWQNQLNLAEHVMDTLG